jgi:hypothetical protein
MRSLLAGLFVVSGIFISAAPVEGAVSEAGVGIRLLEAPSDRQDDPRARSYIIDHLAPGTTITRKIEVSNGTTAPASIDVYAGGAELTDGEFRPFPQTEPSELQNWTKVDVSKLELAPGQKAPATVTIAVPDDASPGERYGAVWAALSSPPGAGGITQVNRVGVRIYLSIGPGGEPASDFSVTSLTAKRNEDGTPVVTAEVRNTGGRALDLGGELRLTDGPGGLSGGPFAAELGTTLGVDKVAPVTILLDKELPDGPWQAELTLKSGILERSASAEITFPEGGGSSTVAVNSDDSGSLIPIAGGVVGVLLLGGLGYQVIRKKKITA